MNNEKLKEKLRKTMKEVSDLRGEVITCAINIEGGIDGIIENYFILPEKQSDFSTIALSDESFTFGLKKMILFKILNQIQFPAYREFREELNKLNRLRNRFAHSFMFGFDGALTYPKGEKPMEIKMAKEMHDEFMKIYPKVFDELEKIFWFLLEKKGIKKSV